ncbi:MAG: hypothetical protein ACI4E3_07955 [Candidatus Fimousia sp.]
MEENEFQNVERINQLNQRAYAAHLPLVENICSREASEDELSHLLDYLLDFAFDGKY